MKEVSFKDLNNSEKLLLEAARNAMENAYAKYSHYPVGAAILSFDEMIFAGANMENASYGLTSCAEIGAIQAAVSNGKNKFKSIAITVENEDKVALPCGRCRQVIKEFATLHQTDIRIILSNKKFSKIMLTSIHELLPHPFSSNDL